MVLKLSGEMVDLKCMVLISALQLGQVRLFDIFKYR